MMRSNTIFVEGVADERFIWQLAEHLFGDISERININKQLIPIFDKPIQIYKLF